MENRNIEIFINGNLFRRRDIPNHIGHVNIKVWENWPAGTTRGFTDEILNPRTKKFSARIRHGNTAHIDSSEIEWVDGNPYLKKRTKK